MSEYFSKADEEKTYIPPDYDSPREDDDDDSEIGEVLEEDEGKIESEIDEINSKEEESKKMTTTPFGTPVSSQPTTPSWNPPTFGQPQSSPFGGGSTGSSPWSSRTPSWGQGGSSIWQQKPEEKREIDRKKKIIFCDFLDCIVETWDSQGRPGYLPRDIYDLKPRFEVWGKIQAFNPEQVYSMIPINLIPNTNGAAGWIKTLEYYCCCLSSWLRIPYDNCKILAQTAIGQPKEDLIQSILNGPGHVDKKDVIYVGIYSGLSGQSNKDQLAASNCDIDYVDLGILLNNMY
jgi:hypothetical protein